MKISVVSTLYRSEKYILEFHERMSKAISQLTNDYEIIFVNDGSPDNSLAVAHSTLNKDKNVVVVDLSRNFGHHKAMMTGLEYAKGDYVFLIDSDLEEKPELLLEFWQELHSDKNIDVVFGVQEQRKGKWPERLSGYLFYSIFNFLADVKMPRNFTTCRLMKRTYLDSLLLFSEREITIGGLWIITGFNQRPYIIKKGFRGYSTYSFLKKIELMLNSIISFSDYPLTLILKTGFAITFISLAYLVYICYQVFTLGHSVVGWPSLIVSIWFFGGITMMSLGIIGKYVAKIFLEVKQRPRTIVKQVLRNESAL